MKRTDFTSPPGTRLNLLLITADDMNATMPGWMGNPHKPTPHMDAFAATAHRFINNRAAAPICQPSRQAIMTGLPPHRNGGLGFNPIRPGLPTLVTVLQSEGYFTAVLNKIGHMLPESCFPWDHRWKGTGKNPEEVGRQTAIALTKARELAKPFFLNCNITDPHRPFYGVDDAENPQIAALDLPHPFKPEDITAPSSLEDLPGVREEFCQYYNSVQRLDATLGKVLAALNESGMAERTVVLFVSDHGMPFPLAKNTVYNHGLWCPVLLRYPGMSAPQEHHEWTSSIDIMPTLLDLLGVERQPAMDGRSWLPLLKGETQPGRDHVFGEVNSVVNGDSYPQRLVQTSTGALIFSAWPDGQRRFRCDLMAHPAFQAMAKAAENDARIRQRVDQYTLGMPLAFYDMVKDPDQRTNVIDKPEYRDQVDCLKKMLFDYLERTHDPQFENYELLLTDEK